MEVKVSNNKLEEIANRQAEDTIKRIVPHAWRPANMERSAELQNTYITVHTRQGTIFIYPIVIEKGKLLLGDAYRKEIGSIVAVKYGNGIGETEQRATEEAQRLLESISNEEKSQLIEYRIQEAAEELKSRSMLR